MPKVDVDLDVVAIRPYGGSLLAVLSSWIDWAVAPAGLVQQLVDCERSLLESGALSSGCHALRHGQGTRESAGLRGLTTRADYFFRPIAPPPFNELSSAGIQRKDVPF